MGMGVPQNKKRVVEGANMNKLCLLWTLTAAARTRLGVAYWARPINRYSPIPVRVHPTMQLDPKLDRKSNDSLTFFFFPAITHFLPLPVVIKEYLMFPLCMLQMD